MKRLFIFFLSIFVTACSGVSAPAGGNCRGGLCVKVEAVEPIQFGEPVTVTIAVTAEKDISTLGVSLFHDMDVSVDTPQSLEKEIRDTIVSQRGVDWVVDAKANQSLILSRRLRFPSREGLFNVMVAASTPSLRVVHSLVIHMTRAGGKVYLSNTPIPITPGPAPTSPPALRTLLAQPTPTRTSTPITTPTRVPYP